MVSIEDGSHQDEQARKPAQTPKTPAGQLQIAASQKASAVEFDSRSTTWVAQYGWTVPRQSWSDVQNVQVPWLKSSTQRGGASTRYRQKAQLKLQTSAQVGGTGGFGFLHFFLLRRFLATVSVPLAAKASAGNVAMPL
jgi:hypothetical protein